MPTNPLVHTYSADEEWWSKGHGTIFDDADGNWYIVYHSYRNSYHTLGRTSIIESIEWTEDGWPKLANPENDYVEDIPESAQYAVLRDYSKPIMWAKWEPGFEGNELWTITAVDRSYEVCAEFELADNAKGGLYLFYNEEANLGLQDTAKHFFLRIRNEKNVATTEKSLDGENWTVVDSNVDVSGYHHNNFKGFFALRPAILVSEGRLSRTSATVQSSNLHGFEKETDTLFLLAAICVIAAACNPSDKNKSVGKLDEIKQRGTLLVGSTGDYRPLSYMDPQTNTYWGSMLTLLKSSQRTLE